MPLETASTIADLVATNPVGNADSPAALDDHIRLIKTVLKADALVEADKGAANGVATLNASGKVVQTALLADSATSATTAATATSANGIKTATTTVVVGSAAAPGSGQVLTATSSTAAEWATPSTTTIASTAEAQALADNAKMVTPLRLKEALQGSNQSLGTSGYQKLPGGLIIQWMKQSAASGSTAITFPMAFPTACAVVTCTLETSASYEWPCNVVEGTVTASGCTIYRNVSKPAHIIALGY